VLEFVASAYRLPRAVHTARARELLDLVHLAEFADRPVHVLSRGQKQRLGLARAIVHGPTVLLLDEPASGLDLPGRADLLAAVEATAAEEPQLASITVAHHLEELPATTTHVALMRDGRFVAQGDVGLLGDEAALSDCFGRSVRAHRIEGRWFATAV
jgi:iron complex transport system ATP-binding protein